MNASEVGAERSMVVGGRVDRGRGKKTWLECVERDMKECGSNKEMAVDMYLWRRCGVFMGTVQPVQAWK
jgi:hypothetical protein